MTTTGAPADTGESEEERRVLGHFCRAEGTARCHCVLGPGTGLLIEAEVQDRTRNRLRGQPMPTLRIQLLLLVVDPPDVGSACFLYLGDLTSEPLGTPGSDIWHSWQDEVSTQTTLSEEQPGWMGCAPPNPPGSWWRCT